MELTTEIVIDMRDKYINTIVDAVQYDKNSRFVKATLLSGGTRFVVPAGATYRVNFKRSDESSGTYSELSDGSTAVERIEQNILRIGIHELVTSISGKSLISVSILDGNSEVSTFSFTLNVQKAVTEHSDLNKKYPDTYDATVTAADIKSGKTAYAMGKKITGTHICTGGGEAATEVEVESLSDLHLWKKYTADPDGDVSEEELTDVSISYKSAIGGNNTWDEANYADSYEVVDGEIVLTNPTTITLDSSDNAKLLLEKYAYLTNNNYFCWIPSDAKVTYKTGTYYSQILVSSLTKLTVAAGSLVSCIVSKDAAAYPEDGEQNGYWYVYERALG